ncbi:MAG: hypothetical protein QM528_05520 [Phycisphaerales bacterium]|nr:hypothetical protein [Phycisphaerales bacterium]
MKKNILGAVLRRGDLKFISGGRIHCDGGSCTATDGCNPNMKLCYIAAVAVCSTKNMNKYQCCSYCAQINACRDTCDTIFDVNASVCN